MSAPTRNAFSDWIDHRASLFGLRTVKELADRSGINPATLNTIAQSGSLRGVDRSTRAWLARALKVPLREMESFEAGKTPAIPDLRIVDLDRPGGAVAARTNRSERNERPKPVPAPTGRGVPIVGSIISSDQINWFAPQRPESQPRLRIAYPGLTDLFALSVAENLAPEGPEGQCLIFRNEPPPHLSPGDTVLFTFADGAPAGQSRIGQLSTTPDGAAALVPFGCPNAMPIPLLLESIVRAARLLDRFRTSATS